MASEIKSKEDAIRVLQNKVSEFAEQLSDITGNLGGDTAELLKALRQGTLDSKQRAKLLKLKNLIEGGVATQMWTYVKFIGCVIAIVLVFLFVGYYKLYKPMADKERKQIEKKNKKSAKRHLKKH